MHTKMHSENDPMITFSCNWSGPYSFFRSL